MPLAEITTCGPRRAVSRFESSTLEMYLATPQTAVASACVSRCASG